jgi:uncharacterized membrane protein
MTMTERLADFLQSIRAGLSDMPAGAVDQELEYYQEYITDAVEAGRSDAEIREKIGNPAEIIATIRTAVMINNTEQKPGPIGLMRASRKVFDSITHSTVKASLVIGAVIPITFGIMLYLVSVLTVLGALISAALLIHGTIQIPSMYISEKVGMAGLMLATIVLMTSIGVGWWYVANLATRVTMKTLRRLMIKKRGIRITEADGKRERNTAATRLGPDIKKRWFIFTGIGLVGVGLLFSSGLPLRYFSIWNSMKPSGLTELRREFNPKEIHDISVFTLNSRVEIQKANANRVVISYEQPDWMKGTIQTKDGTLIFRERSNGRLPFMDFIAIHEGMTAVKIEVPRGYFLNKVIIESTGGHESIDAPAQEIWAHTLNGNIRFRSATGLYYIQASTNQGTIFIRDVPLGTKRYNNDKRKNQLAVLESANGKIEIDPLK